MGGRNKMGRSLAGNSLRPVLLPYRSEPDEPEPLFALSHPDLHTVGASFQMPARLGGLIENDTEYDCDDAY